MKTYQLDGPSERDTMREMNEVERDRFYHGGVCPFCIAPRSQFLRGPTAGLAINVECPHCECRLNVVDTERTGTGWTAWGQVIREPIGHHRARMQ